MPVRTADAEWRGDLQNGSGQMSLGSRAFEGNYSFKSRMGDDSTGTNPEELIGAAHAGCFSMAFSASLAGAGFTPASVHTTARVHFNKVESGFAIELIELNTEAIVPNIDEETFQRIAQVAKENCPVSKALAAVKIELQAKRLS